MLLGEREDPLVIARGEPSSNVGTNYCTGVANSTGAVGNIIASGSLTVADNNMSLVASDLPNNSFGFYLTSRVQGFIQNPGGSQGNLCLGGQIGRYSQSVFHTGAMGTGSLQLDLTDTPTPSGSVAIQPGETWNFTAWYRDNNGGPTSNFTDGVSITFQ